VLAACTPPVTVQQIHREENAGNYTQAARLIDAYIAGNDLPDDTLYQLNFLKDRMRRITMDFSKDKASVVAYIQKYYPDVNDEMIAQWERGKQLEYMVIDGEKKYFARAASNLFRIDAAAAARKREADGVPTSASAKTLQTHLPEVVALLSASGKTQTPPVAMQVRYTLTVKPNAVPDGETVRCWLPYPREMSSDASAATGNRRQTDVKLLAVNDSNYVISPPSYAHRTLYMEKTAHKDSALRFSIAFSYQSAAEWFDLKNKNIPPYDTASELYKTYTSERPPHVLFTDSIKAISQRIVGDETHPFLKMQKIWKWVDTTFPWASAREYSTIGNIPAYVLENRHGDCGQVTLLFITLARYNGIPARWQSGFMMHPGAVNLHDWSEYYVEGIGWVPMDESFGLNTFSTDERIIHFYSNGIDAYRWIVNDDYSRPLFPEKVFPRSETVDFQRGEVEWQGGNLYFDLWDWDIDVSYDKAPVMNMWEL
jgi:hypothetical protein